MELELRYLEKRDSKTEHDKEAGSQGGQCLNLMSFPTMFVPGFKSHTHSKHITDTQWDLEKACFDCKYLVEDTGPFLRLFVPALHLQVPLICVDIIMFTNY